MNLELHLRIVGSIMLMLVLLNLYVPRRFAWRQELRRLSLFTRQVFIVHAGFILFTLTMFGVLSLAFTSALLEPTRLGRLVLGGLALFWLARLIVQWCVYSPALWRGKRFETTVHFVFTGLWIYFCSTYAAALWLNLNS